MPTDSLSSLKKELLTRLPSELVQICLGLAKLKPDNKQMLAYLLFDSADPLGYAAQVKTAMDALLQDTVRNQYGGTKAFRKAMQLITQYNRFTKFKQGEIELLLHFLTRYLDLISPDTRYPPLIGLAFRALRKARTLVGKLHEDLQYDYSREYNQKMLAVQETFRHWDRNRFPLESLGVSG